VAVVQNLDGNCGLISRGEHGQLSAREKPDEPEILNDVPRPIKLVVLKSALALTQVRHPSNVASVKLKKQTSNVKTKLN
jgi:hypothetical protein